MPHGSDIDDIPQDKHKVGTYDPYDNDTENTYSIPKSTVKPEKDSDFFRQSESFPHCEYRDPKISGNCGKPATRWFELKSTLAYRCEKHQHELISQIYEKGLLPIDDLLDNPIRDVDKFQNSIDQALNRIEKRMAKIGVPRNRIRQYNQRNSMIAVKIRNWSPKRFKKEMKKIKDKNLKKQYEDLWHSISPLKDKVNVDDIIRKGLKQKFNHMEMVNFVAHINEVHKSDEFKNLINEPMGIKEFHNIGIYDKKDQKRILRLNLTRKEVMDLCVKEAGNVLLEGVEEQMMGNIKQCDECDRIRTEYDRDEGVHQLTLHIKKDHEGASKLLDELYENKIKKFVDKYHGDSQTSVYSDLIDEDGKHKHPEFMPNYEELAEKLSSEEAVGHSCKYDIGNSMTVFRDHIVRYTELTCYVKDGERIVDKDRIKVYLGMIEGELRNDIDVDEFIDMLILGTKVMNETNYPIFPIKYTFHMAMLEWIEKNPRDKERVMEIYKKANEIDETKEFSSADKVQELKFWFVDNYPDLAKHFGEVCHRVMIKNIMKIKNYKIDEDAKVGWLQDYLEDCLGERIHSNKVLDVAEQYVTGDKDAKPIPIKHTPTPRKTFATLFEFKNYLHEKGIKSQKDYDAFIENNQLPNNFPDSVNYYRRYGFTWSEQAGKKRREPLTRERLKSIAQKIDKNWDHYMRLKDGLLLRWFKTWGVFGNKDPLVKLIFNNFFQFKLQEKTRTALREWIIEIATGKEISQEQNGVSLSGSKTEEDKFDLLDRSFSITEKDVGEGENLFLSKGDTVSKIFNEATGYLPEDEKQDPELFALIKNFTVGEIWNSFFDDPLQALHEPKNGDIFHDKVVDQFREEFAKVKSLDYKKGQYRFSKGKPTVLQLYGVFRAMKNMGFLNMFGTGSGKTLVGFLLAKAIEARKVLWICPKSVISQTDLLCMDAYPTSKTSSVLDDPKNWEVPKSFFEKTGKNVSQFHFMNYDKFNTVKNYEKVIAQIKDAKIDLLVFDEGQRLKNRNDETNDNERKMTASTTRKHCLNLIKLLRERNIKCKILMLSATPIVNTINEAISLYELITGIKITEITSRNTVDNIMAMYCEFLPYSVRYEPKYDIDVIQKPIFCEGFLPDTMSLESALDLEWLEWESMFTSFRIPKMIADAKKIIEKDPNAKILVYSEYRGAGIEDQLQVAFRDAGFRVGMYTGDDKTGFQVDLGTVGGKRKYYNPFVKGDVNVLIGTKAIAVGVDGIQEVCNHIFFNGLVWTWADFEQVRGRLVRSGSNFKKVYVHLYFARCNTVDFDYEVKFKRIKRKKALGDCLRDGRLPKEYESPKSSVLRKQWVEKLFEERQTGFPTKEELTEKQAEEARKTIEKDLERLDEKMTTVHESVKRLRDEKDD